MKQLSAFIVILLFSTSFLNAQIIYIDVKPDAKYICSKIGCSHQYNLDLNKDGINDFTFAANKYGDVGCNFQLSGFTSDVFGGGSDSNEVTAVYDYLLPINTIINDQNSYGYVYLGRAYDIWKSTRGCACCEEKYSSPSLDGYLGLKLRKGVNTYYGWVSFSVSISYKSVGFTIKNYAYNSIPGQPILAGQTSAVVTQVQKKEVTNEGMESAIQHFSIIQIPKVDMDALRSLQKKLIKKQNDLSEIDNRNELKFKRGNNYAASTDSKREANNSLLNKTKDACPNSPVLGDNFEGNTLPFKHTPGYGNFFIAPESDLAISNAGKIVSISNGFIYYFNEGSSVPVFKDSLQNFCLGYFDPRVLYDPKKDRFIFSCLYYNYSNLYDPDTHVVGFEIAFSKSNDPMDGWNFYFFPHAAFNDNSIADYPQLGINDNEAFITEVRFDKSGNTNMTHSDIIQIDKNAGYAGTASITSQVYVVKLSNQTEGSVVPASGGSTTYGPDMYFMMGYENSNPSNKYYVLEITNTIASGQAVLKTYGPVHSNLTNYPEPLPYQPGSIPIYDDNNPGNNNVQGAFYENGLIQFCQNGAVKGNGAIYVGKISGIPGNLSCTAQTISDPNLFLENSSIAYAGKSSSDNSVMIGIEHTGYNRYPGLSAAFIDNDFKASSLLTVKEGNDTLNSSWGDFSGICRRYNHPGECWMEGEYGDLVFPKVNWIAKLNSPPACEERTIVSKNIQTEKFNNSLLVFPNPFSNSTTILFTLPQPQKVTLRIFDMNGRLVKVLSDALLETGQHEMQWNAQGIMAGTYILQIKAGDFTETKKLSVFK